MNEPSDTSLPSRNMPWRAGLRLLAYLGGGRWRRRTDRPPDGPRRLPEDWLGVCVAATDDPAGDAYTIDHLHELGLRQVRLDFAPASRQGPQQRLLERLLGADFQVCLHLVQPRPEARRVAEDADCRRQWREFVNGIMETWGSRLECIEVGATCNRRKWSGHNLAGLLTAWQIAWDAAQLQGLRIIGLNVTDFEPVYNFMLLDMLRQMGRPPAAHTDNLFVERVTEPEVFDHRILGRAAAGLLRFNLIRKARLLHDIGLRHGLTDFYCTHTAWSLRRIGRLLEQVEEKQADYLSRYLLLAAASGALRRLYWGPLIGQREGLIDDSTGEYPDPPHVTFYGRAPGNPRNYRLRPAFHAMATAGRMLDRATFIKAHTTGPALEILEFIRSDGSPLHAVWTVNARLAEAAACYPAATLATAEAHDRGGRLLDRPPEYFGESPVYLSWPATNKPTVLDRPQALELLRFHNIPMQAWQAFQSARGGGMKAQPEDSTNMPADDCLASLMELPGGEQERRDQPALLRDGRNRVWRSPAPWQGADVIIKQFRVPGRWRRLLDLGKPGKAVRSWNNSQELLRRGLATPRPLAFFAPDDRRRPGFFLCADYRPDCSVRDVFTALAAGQATFRELSADDWYRAIAAFLVKLHLRGVFFRDLSAGNLLVRWNSENSVPDFALIDTARARFHPQALPLCQRLADLKRICHPLHWPGRRHFLKIYLESAGLNYRAWMNLPLHIYDWKHRFKDFIRPLRRKRRRS